MLGSRLIRSLLLLPVIALVSSAAVRGEEADLKVQLMAVHDKWFEAFDKNDTDTMNRIETRDMTLVLNDGYILRDFSPRKKLVIKGETDTKRTLSNVTVREFGDSALLVGIVRTVSPRENSQAATTVSFIKAAGQWKINSAQWTDIAKPRKTIKSGLK